MPVATRSRSRTVVPGPDPDPAPAPAQNPAPAPAEGGRRTVTSAVEGLSVTDVRRCLERVRRYWNDGQARDFSLLAPVDDHATVQDFCFRFVLGHHRKRHRKSGSTRRTTP